MSAALGAIGPSLGMVRASRRAPGRHRTIRYGLLLRGACLLACVGVCWA